MLDIKWLKENKEKYIAMRGNEEIVERVILEHSMLNVDIRALEELRAQKNKLVIERIDTTNLTDNIVNLESIIRTSRKDLKAGLDLLPNFPLETCEKENRILPSLFKKDLKPKGHTHYELHKEIDLEAGTKLSGARFSVLRGDIAKLERKLGNFMLDHNDLYEEVSVPYIVNYDTMYGTGQLPKFAEEVYGVGEQYLIPTAEVSLTNLVANSFVDVMFPMRFKALTPCFRKEAGSAGRDTKGLMRQHQFNKCELVAICREENWEREFDLMIQYATTLLIRLKIPYRLVELGYSDLGFSARKTVDIEVWIPSEQQYREISSISYCGDFQGRRMNAKYKENGKNKFVHTLNGSSLAVGRTLIAVVEHYTDENGVLKLPECLE